MKHKLILFFGLCLATFGPLRAADTFLVENGQLRAEIIIAKHPTRMQRVAAEEFRRGIEKISGA